MKKERETLTNDEIRTIFENRTKLEKRIKELGGTIPEPMPWDDGLTRNHRLMETIADLEAKQATE